MKLIITTQEAKLIYNTLLRNAGPEDISIPLIGYLEKGLEQETETKTELPTMQQLYDAGEVGYQVYDQVLRRFFVLFHPDYSHDDKSYEAFDITYIHEPDFNDLLPDINVYTFANLIKELNRKLNPEPESKSVAPAKREVEDDDEDLD